MSIFKTFKTIFAKSGEPPTEPVEAPSESSERRGRKRRDAREGTRALIIDDSPTIVAALKKFLRSAGYVTLEAGDAERGIEIARTERPDLIFLDIVLPGMNGFAALRFLRRDPATRNLPIIMISGNEQATEQFFGTRIGADDFMKKPFSRFEVFARIERLLDHECVPRRVAPPTPPGDANRM
ncbi:MAG: response regulator [Rhodocyclales bacterium]|nr:response regulator [Rhodocyclales bacterium]MDB5887638.1 response regulator [Rhodocyclales bacterium]